MKDESASARRIAPDGGFGWVIVFASALNSFIYVPLMQSFGLIFKDTFTELGITATQGSLIINLNGAFGLMTGLLNGVLLKYYGYRKIAFLAASLLVSGVILTSFSNSFEHFIITYGLITSLGMGLSKSSYDLALNTYFTKNRAKAVGWTMTMMGLGPILIPQLVNLLMKFYTVEGVTLIFGGFCGHLFVSASLLQPVKWHTREIPEDFSQDSSSEMKKSHNRRASECDSATVVSLLSLEPDPPEKGEIDEEKEPKKLKKCMNGMVEMFDLDLLKDPIFVNIVLGLGLALFAELNFTILTPFILHEFGLNTDQIAMFLSTGGVADIIFRFFAPYIGKYMKKPPRPMYLFTLILLIIGRFSLLLVSNNYYLLLVVALGLGIAKGIRKVFMSLVIPSHVSLEKLPGAAGMAMMTNGTCILVGGLILGVVRDITGSYRECIVIMNFVTLVTVLLWTCECVFTKYRAKARKTRKIQVRDDILLNAI